MLGCIEKISPYELRVSLPHQNIAYVPLNMISDEYTELVQQKLASNPIDPDQEEDLEKIFRLGQYVICRVIESVTKQNKEKQSKRLHVSINPKDVCDQITPDHVVKGMVRYFVFIGELLLLGFPHSSYCQVLFLVSKIMVI